MENNGKSNMKIIIGIMVVVLIAGIFYQSVRVKTPVYAVSIISEAVKKKDSATFEKYVDLDKLISSADKDVAMGVYTVKRAGKGDIKSINWLILDSFVDTRAVGARKTEILEYITNPQTDSTKSHMIGSSEYKLIENSSITDVSEVENDGGYALVSLKVHDNTENPDFNVKLKMHQIEEGFWRVEQIDNYVEIMYPDLALAAGDYKKQYPEQDKKKLAVASNQNPQKSVGELLYAGFGKPILSTLFFVAIGYAGYWIYKKTRKGSDGKKVQKIYGIASTMPPPSQKTNIDFNDLRELKKLLDEGVITQEEFEVAKRKILN